MSSYRVYKNDFKGKSPLESAEQKTFFNEIRRRYPDTYGKLAYHVRNEGKKTYAQVQTEKAEGMTAGVVDIHIPGSPAFVCELKRKSGGNLPQHEREYLELSAEMGAFACLCYGWECVWEAFEDWKDIIENRGP